jgi:deoxyribonuclease (pyrimidine dimer)
MVRINLINPKNLADQHLIAEYNEILMLLGYVKKHSCVGNIPEKYCLGKGHIKFFKNKLKYLKKRFDLIKKEMLRRDFSANKEVNLNIFNESLKGNWKPCKKDKEIIKERLIEKIKKKPEFYTYIREHKPEGFFLELINKD